MKDEKNYFKLQDEIKLLRATLNGISDWCKALSERHSLEVFPEPDLEKAHRLLKAEGMTLDAISASIMRRVLYGIQDIINVALEEQNE